MPDMVTLKINGQTVTVPKGTYILKAAQMAGIDVPNFCYQQELRPWGSCRICTVEILGRRGGLVESCATPVREGMEVATHSPACIDARQQILRLYLIDHALDCAICDASGECYLQDYTYEHGIDENPYRRPKRKAPTKHFSDLIDYNWDRCIMCARCARVCDEVIGATALAFGSRGLESEITPAFGNSLYETPCTHCGMCIQVCPVGALTDQRYGNHPWRVEKTATICSYCSVGCTLDVWREDQEIVKVEGKVDIGVNQGWTCVKGRWGHDAVKHEERLTRPLVRRAGRLEPATWAEALDYVAAQLARYQGDGFAAIASPRATNEETYIFGQFVRAVMGTNNIEHDSRRTHAATLSALGEAFGLAAATNSMAEMLDASCFLLVGSNMAEAQPVMSYNIVRSVKGRDAKLIVINPTEPTILGDLATLWLAPRPGAEGLVLSAMAKVVLEEGLADEAAIAGRTEGFEAWRASLEDLSLETLSRFSGVAVTDIQAAARLYATGGLGAATGKPEAGWPAAMLFYGTGITQQAEGEAAVRAACNLALMTGNVGRPLGGVNPLRLEANEQGATDMGALCDVLPGGAPVEQTAARAALEARWLGRWTEPRLGARPVEALPAERGLRLDQLWGAVGEGRVRAMYIMGDDPALADPGAAAALGELEFLVVQDTFLSETAQYADVVLPGTTPVEKNGTFTNNERRVQRLKTALAPVGQSRADDEIVRSIARRLGYVMDYRHAAEVMAEIAEVVPAYAGITYERLEAGGLQWPVPAAEHGGTAVLHTERFATASGRAVFLPVTTAAPAVTDGFPQVLTLGDSLYQWRTGVVTTRSRNLSRLEGDPRVEVHPADAASLGVGNGGWVRLTTPFGSARVRAMVTDSTTPGVLYMDAQWAAAPGALLTAPAGQPARKAVPAALAVEPAGEADGAPMHVGTGRMGVV